MKGNLHETVSKLREKVGLPLIPYAEGKVPGTGLSLAVSEYMQGVSNPQMPKETCPRCGHETCPLDCDCKEPDCPGHRANGRMIGGIAHEVTEAEKKFKDLKVGDRFEFASKKQWWSRGMATGPWTKTGPRKYKDDEGTEHKVGSANVEVTPESTKEVSEGTVVEIDGDKVTIWKDNDPPADKVKEGITKVQNLLKGGGVGEATKQLKFGLGKWLEMAREAKKVGNDKRADSIMAAIKKVVAEKELDERTVFGWNETFDGVLAPEYNRSDFSESINDRNLFKAVFLAGGPGSGKSFIAGGMFKGTGARFVNSDIFFEFLLKKKGLPFNIDPSKKIMYGKQQTQRKKAKKLSTSQAGNWVNGMLPLVVDGTGREISKIKKQKQALEKLGYDTSMVFVNTTLDVAIQRNKERKRSVPDETVKKGWQAVQKNIGAFQSLFGGNIMVVDNSVGVSGASLSELKVRLARASMKMLTASLKNRMGSNTIAALQRQGGKYISDIDPEFDKKAIGI